jgi:hypothetical protein
VLAHGNKGEEKRRKNRSLGVIGRCIGRWGRVSGQLSSASVKTVSDRTLARSATGHRRVTIGASSRALRIVRVIRKFHRRSGGSTGRWGASGHPRPDASGHENTSLEPYWTVTGRCTGRVRSFDGASGGASGATLTSA